MTGAGAPARDAMTQDGPLLTVVIPFFQRERGILAQAVRSVLAQECDFAFDIIVVDDQSPVPAQDEIGDLIAAHPGRITLLDRPNGGPGAARNTALDSLPRDRRYVAFIDSDDTWEPDHLATGVAVLERGPTFFFSNLFHLDQDTNKFDREVVNNHPNRFRDGELRPIDGLDQCFTYQGDMFDRIFYSGNAMMPQTVIYSFRDFPDARFEEKYRNMGEDYLFFGVIAKAGATYGLSWRPSVRCGHGVNVFEKSGYGTPTFLSRLADERTYRLYAARRWGTTDSQRRRLNELLGTVRTNAAMMVARSLARFDFAALAPLPRYLRCDPMFPLLFPFYLARALLRGLG
ncbi:MAG: glycosyltransferase family 2 protein [Hyphomicrobiales bacterium]|nr:glycosyltransferase family 2 protein [Hyphomicrobiales bacterium]MCP5373317.1 glycosyltransferase family 2 protein [Hyphomicrobiales bacterium]